MIRDSQTSPHSFSPKTRVTDGSYEQGVYLELRRIAQRLMSAEPDGITLQPTALVHEAWVRLGGNDQEDWERRAHFFGAAAEAMRRVLIDAARKRSSQERGGDWQRVTMVELSGAELVGGEDARLLHLDVALERLEAQNPAIADIVKLRYFAGLTIEQTARATQRSPATVKREWTFGLTWIRNEIRKIEDAESSQT